MSSDVECLHNKCPENIGSSSGDDSAQEIAQEANSGEDQSDFKIDEMFQGVGTGTGAGQESTPEGRMSAERSVLTELDEQQKEQKVRKETECHLENMEDRRQDRKLRFNYAKNSFWFAVASAFFFAFIIVWGGISSYFCKTQPFHDKVIICVAGATTVNLFAAFLVITRGLFCVPND